MFFFKVAVNDVCHCVAWEIVLRWVWSSIERKNLKKNLCISLVFKWKPLIFIDFLVRTCFFQPTHLPRVHSSIGWKCLPRVGNATSSTPLLEKRRLIYLAISNYILRSFMHFKNNNLIPSRYSKHNFGPMQCLSNTQCRWINIIEV